MHTESFVGWIDISSEDINRTRDYLRRLEEGTLDELGFGIIRDFFSEEFFPATSTGMSIARQYVLVPFCCLHLEKRILKEHLDLVRASHELRKMENHLRTCVLDHRNPDVQRLPSIVYWASLKKLSVFTDDSSLYTYMRRLVEESRRRYRDDDSEEHAGSDESSRWDPELIKLYDKEKDWLITENRFQFDDPSNRSANGRMTRDEARYLQLVYRRHAEKKPSIMSHILGSGVAPASDVNLPWELHHPRELRHSIQDAQRFSVLVSGARLVYYQLLIEERGKRGLPEFEAAPDYSLGFSSWWEAARGILQGWDMSTFLDRVKPALRGAPRNDGRFLTGFFNLISSHSRARRCFNDKALRNMIRDRECRVRPHKSRLRRQKYLEQWNPGAGATDSLYGLNYRGPIGTSLCTEVIDGLNRGKHNG